MEPTDRPRTTASVAPMPQVTIHLSDVGRTAWIVDDAESVIWHNAAPEPIDRGRTLRFAVEGPLGERLHLCVAEEEEDPEIGAIAALAAHEGEHRARNIVALALAIGHQSLGDRLNDPVIQRFLDRLRSLDAVARVGCEIEGDRCAVEVIARQVTSRFDDPDHSRIDIAGPSVLVPARWAHLLAIVFHELGANAIRHGALRGRAGDVHLRWCLVVDAAIRTSTLHVTWRETGGPPVLPARAKGFGSRILRDIGSVSSRCSANFRLPSTGLDYRLAIAFDDDEVASDP